MTISITRSKEYDEYIEANDLGEFSSTVEKLVMDFFEGNSRYHLKEMWMSMYHDPELDGWIQPQITAVFPFKETSGVDVKIALDIEEHVKKYFARNSCNADEFKAKVMKWREFRLIFQAKPLGGKALKDDKEFYEKEKWLSEQQEKHRGKIISYAKINGEWKVIATGSSEIEILDNLEKFLKENDMSDTRYYFR